MGEGGGRWGCWLCDADAHLQGRVERGGGVRNWLPRMKLAL